MSKLEYDLENFGRLCHLHDKVAKLEQALAEKNREIQQIREHEYQRGYQEAEEKYLQLMLKAVRFAKVVSECQQSDCNQVDAQEYEEAQTFLKEDT